MPDHFHSEKEDWVIYTKRHKLICRKIAILPLDYFSHFRYNSAVRFFLKAKIFSQYRFG